MNTTHVVQKTNNMNIHENYTVSLSTFQADVTNLKRVRTRLSQELLKYIIYSNRIHDLLNLMNINL
ncbi:hypothetical protein PA25_12070 [Pseudoalteromonas sp. A25]|nr:hypothetical protein PA25_12070 [Pseudoalteromonas sp. A25]